VLSATSAKSVVKCSPYFIFPQTLSPLRCLVDWTTMSDELDPDAALMLRVKQGDWEQKRGGKNIIPLNTRKKARVPGNHLSQFVWKRHDEFEAGPLTW
jgi:hypothetical protein